ncbi:hypothetical protein Xmau_03003 [Xenorhabdus mauleonii]|uniref:Uncharacterized protein n=1 Tax=Xenorhabdus mauleonii TaxID=351675 RepID=A0A1I3S8W7_9GAMM|nr:hypothetical protein [Xenorhabdus mauleonii]PHM39099.1 hypothetical protein Xmau_03003 [Xenorhabdus mauleonii]SFJ55273.1 hypothetical protein SAMN05421680_11124 [Xenorhabdus mauleonii]
MSKIRYLKIIDKQLLAFEDYFNDELRLNIHSHGNYGHLTLKTYNKNYPNDPIAPLRPRIYEWITASELMDIIERNYLSDGRTLNDYKYIRLASCHSADDLEDKEKIKKMLEQKKSTSAPDNTKTEDYENLEKVYSLAKELSKLMPSIIIQGYKGVLNNRTTLYEKEKKEFNVRFYEHNKQITYSQFYTDHIHQFFFGYEDKYKDKGFPKEFTERKEAFNRAVVKIENQATTCIFKRKTEDNKNTKAVSFRNGHELDTPPFE